MRTALIRYRVKPGRAEENAELVRAVYAELAELEPTGFRYATFRDGDTFTHVAFGDSPLQTLAAFARFREGLSERCEAPPRVSRDLVGEYGLLSSLPA
jgi:hypothetical protein